MSRLPSIIAGNGSRIFSIEAKVEEVVASIGSIPTVLTAVLAERTIDAMSYHRRKVISQAAKWRGGRDAQKFVASRLFRYGRKNANPTKISDVAGESFAAAESGPITGPEVLKDLEEGGQISSSAPMFIPFVRIPAFVRRKLDGYILPKDFFVTPSGLVIQSFAGRGKAQDALGGLKAGARSKIVGIFRRGRFQRPTLGFYAAWEAIEAKVIAKYDRDLEMALTEIGRGRLAERLELASRSRDAAADAAKAYLSANAKDFAGARRVAEAAKRRVVSDALAAKGSRA